MLAVLLSIAPITSSLWLDETGTWWVVKDGIRDVLARSWQSSGLPGNLSPPYYVMAWIARHFASWVGLEVALRLPSLLAFVAALLLIYRLGSYLMNPRAGMLAALALACTPGVSFAAIDARPYALGLALVIASMLAFLKWRDTGKARFAALYILCTALVIYCHCLFGLALAAPLFCSLRYVRKLALMAAAAVLCLPLGGQLLHFYRTRQSHSLDTAPNLIALYTDLAAPLVIAGVLLLAFFAFQRMAPLSHRIHWPWLFAWLLVPPVVLFAVSSFTGTGLFVPRYYLSCAPALALIAAYAMSRSAPRVASVLLTVLIAHAIWKGGPAHGHQDWRGAMSAVNSAAGPGDTVLVATCFVEGTDAEIDNPSLRDVLFAPQLVYPLRRQFSRLPVSSVGDTLPANLPASQRVFLITCPSNASRQYEAVLKRTLSGYVRRELTGFGWWVSVVAFEQ